MTQAEMAVFLKAVQAMTGVSAPKAKKAKKVSWAERLADKDKKTLRGFAKKGITGVVLMDRADPSKEFNVRPFNGWVAQGRVVRKGETSVNGLFHFSQTDELTAKPAAA